MSDPACRAAYVKAIDYIGRKTQHWPSEQFHALFAEPRFREGEAAIMAAIDEGDLTATRAACKVWWTYILAYQPVEVSA